NVGDGPSASADAARPADRLVGRVRGAAGRHRCCGRPPRGEHARVPGCADPMTLRRFPGAALLAGALLVPAGPTLAFDSLDHVPEPTAKQLAVSVRQWDPEGSVRSFADEADESSWTLATDVLFRVDSFDLPESAPEHLSDLLAD